MKGDGLLVINLYVGKPHIIVKKRLEFDLISLEYLKCALKLIFLVRSDLQKTIDKVYVS